MKQFVYIVIGVLIAMAAIMAISVGCARKAPIPTQNVTGIPTQNVTGILKGVNTPAEAGNDAITVQTPAGLQTITVTTQTQYSLDGEACAFEQVGQALESANTTYICTVVYNAELGATAIYVTAEKIATDVLIDINNPGKDINTPAEAGSDNLDISNNRPR